MEQRQVKDIKYCLLPGTDRKTTDIVVERDGTVSVRPPLNKSPEDIDKIVFSRRMWIYRTLAEWHDLNQSRVAREWVNGESFLYLGRHYQLSLEDTLNTPVLLKNGRFLLQKKLATDEGKKAEQAFEEFYTRKGLHMIRKRVAYFAPKVGVNVGQLSVKDIGYKWASCKSNGDLSFHWKCMMAPLKILDYLIVHELCHNHHRNHTTEFWNEVDKVLPDYQERKEWLRQHGASLNL